MASDPMKMLNITNHRMLRAKSCPTLCHTMDCGLPSSCPWDSLGKNTGVGCHFLLQSCHMTQQLNS